MLISISNDPRILELRTELSALTGTIATQVPTSLVQALEKTMPGYVVNGRYFSAKPFDDTCDLSKEVFKKKAGAYKDLVFKLGDMKKSRCFMYDSQSRIVVAEATPRFVMVCFLSKA